MRNVLVIAYYFPPLGMSGVQRTAGFVRHLPEYGWQPTVITAKPAGYFAYDESLWTPIQDAGISVIRTPSIDPTRLYCSYTMVKFPSEQKLLALSLITSWIFVPDNKLGWTIFAIPEGLNQLRQQRFDIILSTAPPYTGHLIGSYLSKKLDIPLVCDFRDDWVGNPRHYYPTILHRKLHLYLENRVLKQSSAVITITQPVLDQLNERHPESIKTQQVIPHGFDRKVITNKKSKISNQHLRFLYTGVFFDAQVPDYFLRGLSSFLSQNPSLRTKISAIFAGLVPDNFIKLLRTLDLEGIVDYVGYKQHKEIQQLQHDADVLWMTLGAKIGNYGISPGKLFEYMGTRKPILALVPEGAARDTLLRYGATYLAQPNSTGEIIQAFNKIKTDWLSGTFPTPDETFVSMFDRSQLTHSLAQIFNNLSKL